MDKTPIVVDLDGTLICGDSFLDALFTSLQKNFFVTLIRIFNKNAAAFKWEIYKNILSEKDLKKIKWNESLIEKLNIWKKQGRKIVLMSAAPQYYVEAIAKFLSAKITFDDAAGSTQKENRRAEKKAAWLIENFKEFDYIGNSQADIPVWRVAKNAYNVNPSRGLVDFARKQKIDLQFLARNRQNILMEICDIAKRNFGKSSLEKTIYIDLTRTWESGALTGIQRVAIEYLRALREMKVPVVVVRANGRGLWQLREAQVKRLLSQGYRSRPSKKRGRRWRYSGLQKKITRPTGGVLFAPEVFAPELEKHLPKFRKTIAMVNDVFANDKVFNQYLRAVEKFDLVIVPSRDTQASYTGQSIVIEHGVALPKNFQNIPTPKKKILCLGSLEPRKNHEALLDACEELWKQGEIFELQLVGLLTKKGKAAAKKIRDLKKKGRKILWKGTLSDSQLEKIWQKTWALIYASHEEGFGLPVVEALARGVPAVCGQGAALKERTRHGGCEVLPSVDANEIAQGIKNILQDERRENLAMQARAIKTRTWAEAARELLNSI